MRRSASTERQQRFRDVPAKARRRVAEDPVCTLQTSRECGLHGALLHRVRPRLEQRNDARRAGAVAHGFERGADRRRMMGEIVDDTDSAHGPAQLQAAAYSTKLGKGLECDRRTHADMMGRRDRRECIQAVVRSGQPDLQRANDARFMTDLVRWLASNLPRSGRTETDDFTPATALQYPLERRFIV